MSDALALTAISPTRTRGEKYDLRYKTTSTGSRWQVSKRAFQVMGLGSQGVKPMRDSKSGRVFLGVQAEDDSLHLKGSSRGKKGLAFTNEDLRRFVDANHANVDLFKLVKAGSFNNSTLYEILPWDGETGLQVVPSASTATAATPVAEQEEAEDVDELDEPEDELEEDDLGFDEDPEEEMSADPFAV